VSNRFHRGTGGSLFERLAARSEKSLYSGTLAATVPGVRFTDQTAAERYEVQPEYQRFEQRMNMTRQGRWQPDAVALNKNREENRKKLVLSGKAGYSLLDWGFTNAAEASQKVSSFGLHVPNRGPTGWQPIGPRPPEGMGRWQGSPDLNSRALKKVGRIFGAGDVGITLLDRRWVYSTWFDEKTKQSYPIRFSDEPGFEGIMEPTQQEDNTLVIPASMKYVAVFVLPMNRQGVRASPTLTSYASTQVTYSAISRLIVSMAEFIRGLGYNAIPSSNCTAASIPLAIDAGLGELGRNAKLIHPVWGPICRICKVITDLPLEPDRSIETGATAFCETCGKCADVCPSRAIPRGPRSFEPAGDFSNRGVRQWQADHRKCFEFWSKCGTNCGLCLSACPFNKGEHWTHGLVKAAIARFPELDQSIVALDDAFGYGQTDPGNFWR
jgi:epoxyqueuosine reductase